MQIHRKTACFVTAAVMSLSVFSNMGIAVGAQMQPIVYEADIKNGLDVFGSAEKAVFNSATLNFKTGAIQITNPLGNDQTGETAYYALPPNGESFRFSYIVDPNTAAVSVAINGEIEASGICASSKGVSSIGTSWGGTVTVSNAGIKTLTEQSASIEKCSTASVKIKLQNPVQYSELSKIGVYTSDGRNVKIADFIKDNETVELMFAQSLENGKTYTVKAENIPDIYGVNGSFNLNFTPTESASAITGKDLEMSEDTARAWGFERRIDWHEETRLSKNNGWLIGQTVIGNDNSQEFFKRLYAMPLSDEHKSQGNYSLKWDNHPFYSTVATEVTERDWTGANMFNIWIYSEEATGETVNILIYSDNPKTPWLDGYTYPVKVDWKGEKQLSIPLEDFYRFENPTGFDNVSAIYFTTKIFNGEPNPYTVLYLDDMRVTYSPSYPITPHPSARTEKENPHRALYFDEQRLNHNYPEVKEDVTAPFEYQAYYKAERALYGYFPKYNPGVASFDKDGKTYIRGDGTHIQYLENGEWKTTDILPAVKKVISPYSEKIYDVGYEDPVIRFDNDGWVYVLVNVDAKTVLCWSADGMKTWNAKSINISSSTSGGQSTARFEHIDGGNTEAMNRPPIILLNTPSWSSDKGGYMAVLSKTSDGDLTVKKIKYADKAITTAAHTGDGSFIVSRGNEAFVVYGIPSFSDKESGITSYLDYQEQNPSVLEKIPTDHNAVGMTYERAGQILQFKNGIPTFIRKVNLTDGSLSDPVFVGFGGVEDDDHNWPGIAIDGSGYLHVIMNGHHDPVCYTKSKNPLDITEWSDIEKVGTYNSYGAILTDNNSGIHIMTRDASRGYRFDTSVVTKNGNGTREKSYIVKRTAPYYEVARQRMSYNPVTDEFFTFYYAQSNYFEVFKDEYDGALFTWPNEERCMRMSTLDGGYNNIPVGTDRTNELDKHYCHWELDDAAIGREGVLVKSGDGTKSFTLVKTSDCK